MSILSDILDQYCDEEILLADGFDNAVIGIDEFSYRLIYSKQKCIDILTENMTEEEALEHFSYNVSGSYVGEKTPIFCDDMYQYNFKKSYLQRIVQFCIKPFKFK